MTKGGTMDSSVQFAELVSKARQGDASALDAIFRTCRDYLLLIANQEMDERLKTTCAASDLVQATLVQANHKFDQFRGDCQPEFLGWVKAILKNEMKGSVRKHFQTEKRAAPLPRPTGVSSWLAGSATHPIDPELTPAAGAELEEDAQLLRLAILRLSEDHREVLLLRNWQRRSFAEIAIEMQRTENAAKKLWARALVALGNEMCE
jgi:RNA polymerase sigma-70 factor (ECF subfamily)